MRTIAVYKTDIDNKASANAITDVFCRQFPGCEASFDLEDRDNVLRIEIRNGVIKEKTITEIIEDFGYKIETLL